MLLKFHLIYWSRESSLGSFIFSRTNMHVTAIIVAAGEGRRHRRAGFQKLSPHCRSSVGATHSRPIFLDSKYRKSDSSGR